MIRSDKQVRESANDLLRDVWSKREEYGLRTDDVFSVLHVAPRIAAEKRLLLTIVELPEIPPSPSESAARLEIAGVLCRPDRTIFLSRKFKTVSRRFTLSHEIGHFVMHTELAMHRDRPLDERSSSLQRRSRPEVEADLFAAEFLMPSKQLISEFERRFGEAIETDTDDSSLTFKLMVGTSRARSQVQQSLGHPMTAALLVATTRSFGVTPFEPLFNRFAVSPTAMAIQLLDLALVVPTGVAA